LLPEQQGLAGLLAGRANDMITNPGAGLAPIRAGLRDSVNSNFAGADRAIASKMLTSGGNRSGKAGRAAREMEMARAGALGGADQQIYRMILDQQDRGTGIAERLLSQNFGQTTTGSTSSTGNSTMNGTNTQPGSALAGGISGGLSTLMALLGMDKMLQPGGGQGGNGMVP
jgi:hypothetical protein